MLKVMAPHAWNRVVQLVQKSSLARTDKIDVSKVALAGGGGGRL